MRIAICDDNAEDLAAYSARIAQCVGENGEPVEILRYSAGEQLLFALSDAKEAADLIFLDIHMPTENGIDVAKKLHALGYRKDVVFLTVSDQHMLPAFDVGAFNYLVKGQTSEQRFRRVIRSAVDSAREKSDACVLLSAGGENRYVAVSDILYFEVVSRIIVCHYRNETFEFFSTLGKLENKLRNYGFLRINRSMLVAKSQIEQLTYTEATLRSGDVLPVSRGKYNLIRQELDGRS